MWFMGHAALGLLIGLPFSWRQRSAGRDPLGYTPALVLLLILSANLPDALHLGELRAWTHNFAVGSAASAGLALMMRRPARLSTLDSLAVAAAGLAHPAGDLLFGHYHPFFPFDPASDLQGLQGWNSSLGNGVEAGLAAIPLAILYHPRAAGRRLWDNPGVPAKGLLGLCGVATIALMSGNLAVFAALNLMGGVERSGWGLMLFLQGIAMAIPLALRAMAALGAPPAHGRGRGRARSP
jgi:hypothetical protein